MKKIIVVLMTGLVWISAAPCSHAQLVPAGPLVNIMAVDKPAWHILNHRKGLGSEVRYGQGIIIDASGIIVTNKHIIGNAGDIEVALPDGQTFKGRLLHQGGFDLCLIKISSALKLKPIILADPSKAAIGSAVIAITHPGLKTTTIHDGRITNVFNETVSNTAGILEMRLATKPGDSGGAILNEHGLLLGLIMGKRISDPGKSLAIASSQIRQEYANYRKSQQSSD